MCIRTHDNLPHANNARRYVPLKPGINSPIVKASHYIIIQNEGESEKLGMRFMARHYLSFWKKWKYGFFYFTLIPVFASLYTFFPSGFYQSTIEQEGVIQGIHDQFSEVLAGFLRRRLSSSGVPSMRSLQLSCHENSNKPVVRIVHSVSPFFKYGNSRNFISSVWANITLIEQCNDEKWLQTLFNVNADIHYGSHRKLHFTYFVPSFQFDDKAGSEEIFDLIKTGKNQCDELKSYFPSLLYKDKNCFLILNDEETNKLNFLLNQYDQSLKGKIAGQNEYWRMFYLSTVTITTLGYGDIVPIKDITRLFVALQSILGLFFMGLFLDSIVNARKRSQ